MQRGHKAKFVPAAARGLLQRRGSKAVKLERPAAPTIRRAPRDDERSAAREFLASERAAAADANTRESAAYTALAHALFSTKEFVFLR